MTLSLTKRIWRATIRSSVAAVSFGALGLSFGIWSSVGMIREAYAQIPCNCVQCKGWKCTLAKNECQAVKKLCSSSTSGKCSPYQTSQCGNIWMWSAVLGYCPKLFSIGTCGGTAAYKTPPPPG